MLAVYIDPASPTNGAGTLADPRNSLPGTLVAGTQYLLKSGTTLAGSITIGQSGTNGTDGRIVVGSYGAGAKPIINAAGQLRGVNIGTNCKWVTVQGLDIRNATEYGVINTTTASLETIETYIDILDCDIHDLINGAADRNGVMLWGRGNRILRCHIYNIPTDGIWMKGPDAEVGYCTVRAVSRDGRLAGDCVQFGGGDCSRMWVHHNYLDHSDVDSKQCVIISGSTGAGGVWEANVAQGFNSAAHVPLYPGQPGLTVRGNLVIGGAVGINSPAAGVIIERNVILNAFGRGIDANTSAVCRGNIVLGNGQSAIGIRNNSGAAVVTQNLVARFATGIQRTSAETANTIIQCATAVVDGSAVAAALGADSQSQRMATGIELAGTALIALTTTAQPAPIAWPATLPVAYAEGFGFEPVDPVIRTEMEAGAPRYRRRFAATPTRVQARWRFTQPQMATFETYWQSTLLGGQAEFSTPLHNGAGLSTWTCRFASAWRATRLAPNLFEVSAELLATNRPVI